MRLECWSLFDSSHREVAMHQANGEWKVTSSLQKEASTIHKRLAAVYRCGLDLFQSLLHLLKTAGVPQEDREIEPGAGSPIGRGDAGTIFALCFGVVFIFLSDTP